MKIDTFDQLEKLMQLANKHKVNKITIGDFTLELNEPAPKQYKTKSKVAPPLETPKQTLDKTTQQRLLEALDADLFVHEGFAE